MYVCGAPLEVEAVQHMHVHVCLSNIQAGIAANPVYMIEGRYPDLESIMSSASKQQL